MAHLITNELIIADSFKQNLIIQAIASKLSHFSVFKPYFAYIFNELLLINLTNAEAVCICCWINIMNYILHRNTDKELEIKYKLMKFLQITVQFSLHPNLEVSKSSVNAVGSILESLKTFKILNQCFSQFAKETIIDLFSNLKNTEYSSQYPQICSLFRTILTYHEQQKFWYGCHSYIPILDNVTNELIELHNHMCLDDEWVIDVLVRIRVCDEILVFVRLFNIAYFLYVSSSTFEEEGNQQSFDDCVRIYRKILKIFPKFSPVLTEYFVKREYQTIFGNIRTIFMNDITVRPYVVQFLRKLLDPAKKNYDFYPWISMLSYHYFLQHEKNEVTHSILEAIRRLFSFCDKETMELFAIELNLDNSKSDDNYKHDHFMELLSTCHSFVSHDYLFNELHHLLILVEDKKQLKQNISELTYWLISYESHAKNFDDDVTKNCALNKLKLIEKFLDNFFFNFDSYYSSCILNCIQHLLPFLKVDIIKYINYISLAVFNPTSKIVKRSDKCYGVLKFISCFISKFIAYEECISYATAIFDVIITLLNTSDRRLFKNCISILFHMRDSNFIIPYKIMILNSIVTNKKILNFKSFRSKVLSLIKKFKENSPEDETPISSHKCYRVLSKLLKLNKSKHSKHIFKRDKSSTRQSDKYDFDDENTNLSYEDLPLGISKVKSKNHLEENHFELNNDGKYIIADNKDEIKKDDTLSDASDKNETERRDIEITSHVKKCLKSKLKNQKPGGQYRAKKAGGDCQWKNNLEPYAYIPLDRKSLKNKGGKCLGQFKGIIKARNKRCILVDCQNAKLWTTDMY
ncbi:hypothetical protein HZS_1369 [Henneguya salminicola]|nr:hypothetical protein HZS_1369 [Henneguya salminicola]